MLARPLLVSGLLASLCALFAGCATPVQSPPPEVAITVKPLNIEIDTSKSKALITEMANEVRHGDADGITVYSPGYRINTVVSPPEISFYVSNITVMLAKELAPASCRYAAVLDHEFRHVNTVQHVMAEVAEELGKELKGHTYSADALARKASETFSALTVRLADAQDKVDSAQEAERLDHFCHHNVSTGILKAFDGGLVTYAPDIERYRQPPRLHKVGQSVPVAPKEGRASP